jgi:hypothetical protein
MFVATRSWAFRQPSRKGHRPRRRTGRNGRAPTSGAPLGCLWGRLRRNQAPRATRLSTRAVTLPLGRLWGRIVVSGQAALGPPARLTRPGSEPHRS